MNTQSKRHTFIVKTCPCGTEFQTTSRNHLGLCKKCYTRRHNAIFNGCPGEYAVEAREHKVGTGGVSQEELSRRLAEFYAEQEEIRGRQELAHTCDFCLHGEEVDLRYVFSRVCRLGLVFVENCPGWEPRYENRDVNGE